AHQAATVPLGLHQVVEIELGLSEEGERPLLLELDHLALQDADGGLRHAAVALQVGGALAGEILEHGAQVVEVEELELAVVAVLEDEREHAGLSVVQVEHLREQERSERRYRGPALGSGSTREAQKLDREGRW